MRLMAVAVAAALAVGAAFTVQAQEQPRQKRAVREAPVSGTYVMHRDENGRTRTKILVQKRSYLDGGTEVMPGDNIDPYRSSFLMHQPWEITKNTVFDQPNWVKDPFFLPGKNNPYPWSGN